MKKILVMGKKILQPKSMQMFKCDLCKTVFESDEFNKSFTPRPEWLLTDICPNCGSEISKYSQMIGGNA